MSSDYKNKYLKYKKKYLSLKYLKKNKINENLEEITEKDQNIGPLFDKLFVNTFFSILDDCKSEINIDIISQNSINPFYFGYDHKIIKELGKQNFNLNNPLFFFKGSVEIINSFNDYYSEGIFAYCLRDSYLDLNEINYDTLKKNNFSKKKEIVNDNLRIYYGLKKDKNNKINLFIKNDALNKIYNMRSTTNKDIYKIKNIVVYGDIKNGIGRCVFFCHNNSFIDRLDFTGEFKNGRLINGLIYFYFDDLNKCKILTYMEYYIQVLDSNLIFKNHLSEVKDIYDEKYLLSKDQRNEKSPYYNLTNKEYILKITKVPYESEILQIMEDDLVKDIKNNKTKFKFYELEDFLIEYELTILFGDFKFKIIEDLKKSKKK